MLMFFFNAISLFKKCSLLALSLFALVFSSLTLAADGVSFINFQDGDEYGLDGQLKVVQVAAWSETSEVNLVELIINNKSIDQLLEPPYQWTIADYDLNLQEGRNRLKVKVILEDGTRIRKRIKIKLTANYWYEGPKFTLISPLPDQAVAAKDLYASFNIHAPGGLSTVKTIVSDVPQDTPASNYCHVITDAADECDPSFYNMPHPLEYDLTRVAEDLEPGKHVLSITGAAHCYPSDEPWDCTFRPQTSWEFFIE